MHPALAAGSVTGSAMLDDVDVVVQALFSERDLGEELRRVEDNLAPVVRGWNPDRLLTAPQADVIEALEQQFLVPVLLLHRGQAELLEEQLDTRRPIPATMAGRTAPRVTRRILAVPFTGDREHFHARAGTFGLNPPQGYVAGSELYLVADGGHDGPAIRVGFERQLDQIDEFLGWTNRDIEAHNDRMRARIAAEVSTRRHTILTQRQITESVEFPVRRRDQANVYAVPVVRRQLATRPSERPDGRPHPPFASEPALANADYEAALSVLGLAAHTLERTPSTTAKLGEEEIRNLLLVALNGQFEGHAGGELFNGEGKVDILVRVQDRNIFIGECKIWAGPHTIDEAMDQLLDYLVWRDTKAALLLFIRAAEVTAQITKAVARLEARNEYKRRGAHAGEDRHDFIFRSKHDPDREIRLAMLPFVIGQKP